MVKTSALRSLYCFSAAEQKPGPALSWDSSEVVQWNVEGLLKNRFTSLPLSSPVLSFSGQLPSPAFYFILFSSGSAFACTGISDRIRVQFRYYWWLPSVWAVLLLCKTVDDNTLQLKYSLVICVPLLSSHEFELLAGAPSMQKGFQLSISQWNCSSSQQVESNMRYFLLPHPHTDFKTSAQGWN